MLRFCHMAFFLVALTITAPVFAVSPFAVEYDLQHGVLSVGRMTRTLTIEGNRYALESRLEAGGLVSLFSDSSRTEISRGRIENGRFLPEHFSYDRSGEKKDYSLEFDYAGARVRRTEPGQQWQTELPSGALDLLSYQVQLMHDLAQADEALTYTVVAKNKVKQYRLDILGVETVETEFGDFETVKVQRADKDSKKRTLVWMARSLDWVPVAVEYRDKRGNTTRATLRGLRSDAARLGKLP